MAERRKPDPPVEEGAPAWMNTYGDMVTLLLTFFVLLFSISTINAQKWEQVVQSFTGAPYRTVQALDSDEVIAEAMAGESWDPEPYPANSAAEAVNDVLTKAQQEFNELYERIKAHIVEKKLMSMLVVEKEEETILIRMTDSALFDSGKDKIRPDSYQLLHEICGIVSEYDELIDMIRVEGHTDDVPIKNAAFEDNLDLSAMRATNVIRYMLDMMDMDASKLVAIGYGEYRPVDTNETETGKARNRRVDFVIQGFMEDK